MAKFRLLTTAEKTNVVRLHGMGKSQKDIAEIYSINQSPVSRILGAITSLMTNRSGRPRKTTKKTDSLISREVKKNPFISAREIKNSTPLLQNVSERTIRHRLSKDLKMPARKPRRSLYWRRKWDWSVCLSASNIYDGPLNNGKRWCSVTNPSFGWFILQNLLSDVHINHVLKRLR